MMHHANYYTQFQLKLVYSSHSHDVLAILVCVVFPSEPVRIWGPWYRFVA